MKRWRDGLLFFCGFFPIGAFLIFFLVILPFQLLDLTHQEIEFTLILLFGLQGLVALGGFFYHLLAAFSQRKKKFGELVGYFVVSILLLNLAVKKVAWPVFSDSQRWEEVAKSAGAEAFLYSMVGGMILAGVGTFFVDWYGNERISEDQ